MGHGRAGIVEIETVASGGRIGLWPFAGRGRSDVEVRSGGRDWTGDLDALARWNAAAVVTLAERPFGRDSIEAASEIRRRFMEWHAWPEGDGAGPGAAELSATLAALLARGAHLAVACEGGPDEAAMVAACLLADMGLGPDIAIRRVLEAVGPVVSRQGLLKAWREEGGRTPPVGRRDDGASIRDRAVGALVGLAAGDAVGTTIEFQAKPAHALLTDMIGGGPFQLAAGEWTDDTAMALALADSLRENPDLDPAALMTRFVEWHENGRYSCTGWCFDIGGTTLQALLHFKRTGNPLAGSRDPGTAGNGALMRLSPVAIRHWNDRSKLQDVARTQTITTHAADECIEASGILADLLADAIAGKPLADILDGPAALRIKGGWRGLAREDIRGSGYVVHTLQAAVWAVSRTTDFRSAILLAANLGEDADTTAAVAGQIAGAVYGLSGIPGEWLERLALKPLILRLAGDLADAADGAGPA